MNEQSHRKAYNLEWVFNHCSRERWVDGYKPYLTCLNTPSITPVRSSLEPKYARVRTEFSSPARTGMQGESGGPHVIPAWGAEAEDPWSLGLTGSLD